jgi:hypothetical protein
MQAGCSVIVGSGGVVCHGESVVQSGLQRVAALLRSIKRRTSAWEGSLTSVRMHSGQCSRQRCRSVLIRLVQLGPASVTIGYERPNPLGFSDSMYIVDCAADFALIV